MALPKVSVCVDVYNYADYLPDAIESVLSQSFTDFELIVVDDCSGDGSYEIALNYARGDNRVRVYQNSSNLGMVKNRNACLRQAQGEYVKFLHADDYLCSPDALSRMTRRIEANPASSIVACASRYVHDGRTSQGRSSCSFSDSGFVAGTTVIMRCLYEQKNLIGGPSSVLVRRSRAGRGFDENYFHAADLEMWLHLLEQGCFGYIDEPLIAYRWHPRQQTEKDRGSLSQANDQRAMLASYLDKSYIRLRPWQKEYLRHDAVRQTLRRARKLHLPDAAGEVLQQYGRKRYFTNYPGCHLWKKLMRFGGTIHSPEAPTRLDPLKTSVPRREKGINVAGFLKGQYGIGESSRAFCSAVIATGLPYSLINIESRDHSNLDSTMPPFSKQNPYGINLMTFSFDYARRFYRDRGPRFFEERRNIAIWYWELQDFPARWHSSCDYYDEIWAPSDFCCQAIAAVSPVPVRRVTYPLVMEDAIPDDPALVSLITARHSPAKPSRTYSEIPLPSNSRGSGVGERITDVGDSSKRPYLILFNFDFFSTVARKNPLALIAAFRHAFAPNEDVRLVLKSINSQHDPQSRRQIEQAIDGLNVVWIESHLSSQQMQSLFAACDCYVSLHRSEGLGLGMAQAMARGKLVIATGYSGNLEYMRPGNSLMVKYDLVEIPEDCGPYNKPAAYQRGSIWADPDVIDAAEKMRWAYEHPAEGVRIGQQARKDVQSILNPGNTRAEILERIEEIYRS